MCECYLHILYLILELINPLNIPYFLPLLVILTNFLCPLLYHQLCKFSDLFEFELYYLSYILLNTYPVLHMYTLLSRIPFFVIWFFWTHSSVVSKGRRWCQLFKNLSLVITLLFLIITSSAMLNSTINYDSACLLISILRHFFLFQSSGSTWTRALFILCRPQIVHKGYRVLYS